ncbi:MULTISPECIES: DUF397 domain-containing protein [unclassified Streptomyces]|uniref:DUF397 domain-containing protein n=1 Tax=unclassified Streptomyces TaxID=2593676 RepID=UPI0040424145
MRATPIGLSTAQWRRSSYTNADGGNCVEVADGFPGVVPVRDSKNTTGPVLVIHDRAWQRFVDDLKCQSS